MAFNRPFWQNHPDPAMRVTPQSRPGGKPTPVMLNNPITFINTYVCPHCGAVGATGRGNSIFNHFGYCKHKDKTMSKEQLTEIVETRELKKCLMGQYGDFILTHEELLKVMSTIALDKKDPRSALAIKLMYDYHDKIQNKPDEALELGFTGFHFEVLPSKKDLDVAAVETDKYKSMNKWERARNDAADAKESPDIKTSK